MKTKSTKSIKKPVAAKLKKSPVKKAKKSAAKAKSNVALIRTNVNIDKTLHGKAKQFATKKALSLNALINMAIREYVK